MRKLSNGSSRGKVTSTGSRMVHSRRICSSPSRLSTVITCLPGYQSRRLPTVAQPGAFRTLERVDSSTSKIRNLTTVCTRRELACGLQHTLAAMVGSTSGKFISSSVKINQFERGVCGFIFMNTFFCLSH
uniref:(northern house mosquito) hypothetical protein n=1 Tax=Culex pipiens TaxID=7175 RepID=A0A8D8C7Y5_CULPI